MSEYFFLKKMMWRVQSPLAFAQNSSARTGVVGTQGDGLRPTGRGGCLSPQSDLRALGAMVALWGFAQGRPTADSMSV
jgi:hypothetical protein